MCICDNKKIRDKSDTINLKIVVQDGGPYSSPFWILHQYLFNMYHPDVSGFFLLWRSIQNANGCLMHIHISSKMICSCLLKILISNKILFKGTSFPRINILHELINNGYKVIFLFESVKEYTKLRPHEPVKFK